MAIFPKMVPGGDGLFDSVKGLFRLHHRYRACSHRLAHPCRFDSAVVSHVENAMAEQEDA